MFRKWSLAAGFAFIALSLMTERVEATTYGIGCPEGLQTTGSGNRLMDRLSFGHLYPKIDLYSGLVEDIRPIIKCRESGFPWYRQFTRDELQRIPRLMKTDLYKEQAQKLTRGALAMWTEAQITGSDKPSLVYGLKLRDVYDAHEAGTYDSSEYLGALLAATHEHYDAYMKLPEDEKRPLEIARLQLRLATLSHKTEKAGAVDWFERAVTTRDAIPGSTKSDTLNDNIDGVRLCLFAPEELAHGLCYGKPRSQNWTPRQYMMHGIEHLTFYLELYFRSLPDLNLDKYRPIKNHIESVQRERLRDPIFKRSFDRFFRSSLSVGYIKFNNCFFFRPASDAAECRNDDEVWININHHFPDFVTDVRERTRKRILNDAARMYLGGEEHNPAVLWALDQSDFHKPLEREQKRILRAAALKAAETAGKNSIACDIGLVCE